FFDGAAVIAGQWLGGIKILLTDNLPSGVLDTLVDQLFSCEKFGVFGRRPGHVSFEIATWRHALLPEVRATNTFCASCGGLRYGSGHDGDFRAFKYRSTKQLDCIPVHFFGQ